MLKQAGEISTGDKVSNSTNGHSASGNGMLSATSGLISGAATSGGGGGGGGGSGSAGNNSLVCINIPDIPIVTEPDYPERAPKMLGGSIFTRTYGTNERSKLAVAPLLDVSSSGAEMMVLFL